MSPETSPSELSAALDQSAKRLQEAPQEELVFPTTVGQQRFWSLNALHPGNPALNMPLAARLIGKVDRRALQLAFGEILRRHEVLRCRFERDGERLVQVVPSSVNSEINWIDCTGTPEPAVAAKTEALKIEEGTRSFDLAKGPFLRGTVATFNPSDHLLMLTMHHIVSDGWSNGLLLREFAENYTRVIRGDKPPFEDLPLQYADFAVWQQEWLKGQESAAQNQYWTNYLGTQIPVLNLPTDRPRGRQTTINGAISSRLLPTAVSEGFRQICQRENATPFMGYLTAYVMLLHRYTGRSEFVIGSPAACRNQTELEGIIGLFANPILFRPRVIAGMTFRQLLHHVRDTTLANFSNQDYPFEILVENLRAEDSRRGVPWLQAYFIFQKAFLQPQKMPELDLTPLRSISPGAMFEWMLGLVERSEGVRLQLEYNSDLFEGSTIELGLEHLEKIIATAARNLDFPVASLALDMAFVASPEITPLPVPTVTSLLDFLEAGFKKAAEAIVLKCGVKELKLSDLRAAASSSEDPITGITTAVAATLDAAVSDCQADLVAVAGAVADALGVTARDHVLSTGSLDTPANWEELLIAWSRGAMVVRPVSQRPNDFVTAAVGATVVFTASAYVSELLRHESPALNAARVIILGPDPLSPLAMNRLAGCRLVQRVQPAELGVTVALRILSAVPETEAPGTSSPRLIPVGVWEVDLVDRAGIVAPVGIPGRLRARRSTIARPMITGDWMRARSNGALLWVGHADDLDRSPAYTLELYEIADVACKHPFVWEAHAVVAMVAEGGVILHIVPVPGTTPTTEDIKCFLAERLPVYMVPAAVAIHGELPTSSSGRINYTLLREARWLASTTAPTKHDDTIKDGASDLGEEIETKLAVIFSELLHLPRVDPQRSFFDLGGHSLLGMRLFARIEKEFHQRLPLATLLTSPNIRGLADRIRSARSSPARWSCLVPVQTEGDGPKFFCVHGAGGNVLLYRDLARRMAPVVRFYGLQARGLDGSSPCLTRIEDMAELYLQEILLEQPNGPYHLGGYCMGGNIAYEIAQLLMRRGKKVKLVAMLDAYNLRKSTYTGEWPARFRIWMQKGRFHLDTLLQLGMSERRVYLAEKIRMARELFEGRWRVLRRNPTSKTASEANGDLIVSSLQGANHIALRAHDPQPFPGDLTVFRPNKNYYTFQDAALGWGALVKGRLEAVVVTTNPHAMLIEPFVQGLARELTERIVSHRSDKTCTLIRSESASPP